MDGKGGGVYAGERYIFLMTLCFFNVFFFFSFDVCERGGE